MAFRAICLLTVLFSCFISSASGIKPDKVVSLWEKGESRHCERSLLYCYLPQNPTGECVIVCPGGSYGWLGMDVEGKDVAGWLNSKGVAVFVLRYRLGTAGDHYPKQLYDIRRATEWVRGNADILGVKGDRLGYMGFSAGGHLVGLAARKGWSDIYRPAYVAMIYPVISMSEPYSHSRSTRFLLGRGASDELKNDVSLEKNVRSDLPPQFVVWCSDDPIVEPVNSEVYCNALKEAGVPFESHRYEKSGHGFGVSTCGGANDWCVQFERWLGL